MPNNLRMPNDLTNFRISQILRLEMGNISDFMRENMSGLQNMSRKFPNLRSSQIRGRHRHKKLADDITKMETTILSSTTPLNCETTNFPIFAFQNTRSGLQQRFVYHARMRYITTFLSRKLSSSYETIITNSKIADTPVLDRRSNLGQTQFQPYRYFPIINGKLIHFQDGRQNA